MTPEELLQLLMDLNKARRAGFSMSDLDKIAQRDAGMSYKALGRTVGAMREGPEKVPEMTTKNLLRQMGYTATLGWLDELEGVYGKIVKGQPFAASRKKALAEIKAFNKEYPKSSLAMRGTGGVVGTLGVLSGLSGAGVLQAGVPSLGGIAPSLATGGGATTGALAGGGGLLGEDEGTERLRGAAAGGLLGAGTGMLGGGVQPAAVTLRGNVPSILKWGGALLGGGGAGYLAGKLF
jgi:hypothetical protein